MTGCSVDWNPDMEGRFREWERRYLEKRNRQATMPLTIAPAIAEKPASLGQKTVNKIKMTKGRGRTTLCFHLDGIDSGLSLRKQAEALGRVVSYETIRKHRKEGA